MIDGRQYIVAAALVTLAACSPSGQSNEQVQAANTAAPMENMHNQMMANGMMQNGMMANGMMGAPTSNEMPANSNAAVNEHVAHHENKTD